jgi:hypothetical protein
MVVALLFTHSNIKLTTGFCNLSQLWEQQDRYLKASEVEQLASHFGLGNKLLVIAAKLTENPDENSCCW